LFSELNICLVWNQLDDIEAPPQLTTDFVYLRFIGDRSIIDEKDFGTIQKDRIREMQKWARIVKKLKGETIKRVILASNNHYYAGFGPGTADTFRKMIGLPPVQYEEKQQTTLSDL
jgi:hypothetical protein